MANKILMGVLGLVFWFPLAWGQETFTPRYQFTAGDVIETTTVLDVTGTYRTSSSEIPEVTSTPHPARYALEILRRFQVLEAREDYAILQEEILAIREPASSTNSITLYDQNMNVDASPLFQQAEGTKVYRVTSRGEVNLTSQSVTPTRKGLGDWMTGSLFLFPILPADPVVPGATWSQSRLIASVPAGNPLSASWTGVFRGIDNGMAHVGYERFITGNNIQQSINALTASATSITQFRLELKQLDMRSTGEAIYDNTGKHLLETRERFQFTANVNSHSSIYEFPLRLEIRQIAQGTSRTAFFYKK